MDTKTANRLDDEKPADVFGLPYGTLEVGATADLVLIDLKKEQKIDSEHLFQKEKTRHLTDGTVQVGQSKTIFGGNVVWEERI